MQAELKINRRGNQDVMTVTERAGSKTQHILNYMNTQAPC